MPGEERTPLKRTLQEHGRSQRWLAAKIGCHEAEVSRFANRGMIPHETARAAIAEALEVEPKELWPDLYQEAA